MDSVTVIRAFGDNFIYLVEYEKGRFFAVDPGESEGIIRVFEGVKGVLGAILVTHHHFDHVGGVGELVERFGCEVIGPEELKTGVGRVVGDGDVVGLGGVNIDVIGTPGHTLGSVCYYVPAAGNILQPLVFTGDTLFTGGCGRVFETDMATMYGSLVKLGELPGDTLVYPGHDYTEENYRFALKNSDIAIEKRLLEVQRGGMRFTTIAEEMETNVFLRAKNGVEFGKLRRKKDVF